MRVVVCIEADRDGHWIYSCVIGAGTKIRTRDLLITNQLLYQLSYTGTVCQRGMRILEQVRPIANYCFSVLQGAVNSGL
jgi:hypothetical protein